MFVYNCRELKLQYRYLKNLLIGTWTRCLCDIPLPPFIVHFPVGKENITSGMTVFTGSVSTRREPLPLIHTPRCCSASAGKGKRGGFFSLRKSTSSFTTSPFAVGKVPARQSRWVHFLCTTGCVTDRRTWAACESLTVLSESLCIGEVKTERDVNEKPYGSLSTS